MDKKTEKHFSGNAEPQLSIGVGMVFYADEKLQIGTTQQFYSYSNNQGLRYFLV